MNVNVCRHKNSHACAPMGMVAEPLAPHRPTKTTKHKHRTQNQHASKPVAQECKACRYFSSTNANLCAPGRVPQQSWVEGTGPAKHLLDRHNACHRTRSEVRDPRFLWHKERKHGDPKRRHRQHSKHEETTKKNQHGSVVRSFLTAYGPNAESQGEPHKVIRGAAGVRAMCS